jgi:hypothetical protein
VRALRARRAILVHLRRRLKTPYRDGTTHIVLTPVDFIARLAALVPPPRVHLRRFHGVLAAHAALRAVITAAGRGAGARGRVAAPPRLAIEQRPRAGRLTGLKPAYPRASGGNFDRARVTHIRRFKVPIRRIEIAGEITMTN